MAVSKETGEFPRAVKIFGRMPEASYKGDQVNGKRHGHGTMQYPEGRLYKGDWW